MIKENKTIFVIIVIFSVLIGGSIIYIVYEREPAEPHNRNLALGLEFKGIVNQIESPGHDIVEVTIKDNQYELWQYNTYSHLSNNNHESDSTTQFGYNSLIEKGDSLIKIKGHFELRLIKQTTGKEYIFKNTQYQPLAIIDY